MDLGEYALSNAEEILTPALVVYPRWVGSNIDATIQVLKGDANRWRPHLKTVKMPWVVRRLIERGVHQFKCATTRELLMAVEAGAKDVLIAYPLTGANARRVAGIAASHPDTRVSVLIENEMQIDQWNGKPIGIFIDVNPGMNRTGISEDRVEEIAALATKIGPQFQGVHYYDGHIVAPDMEERERDAHRGYDRVMAIVNKLREDGIQVKEIVTSGTPTFPCAITFEKFAGDGFVQRVSPGTIVFTDATSLTQLPETYGFKPAALVFSTVVSAPSPDRVTCDAGHKSVPADAGVPTCTVVGRPELTPLKPSEEHLPLEVAVSHEAPKIGEHLYLVPKHVCPMVNLFDEALVAEDGRIARVERIAARGHEAFPLT